MKARDISKTAVVLVAVMMVSSALFAAPSGRSNNCSTVTSTDGAIWGGGNGPLKASSSPTGTCTGTQVTLSTNQTRSEHGNGFANAFGKMLSGLRGSIETAIWGGGGYNPPPK
jgi:hypothetical protein